MDHDSCARAAVSGRPKPPLASHRAFCGPTVSAWRRCTRCKTRCSRHSASLARSFLFVEGLSRPATAHSTTQAYAPLITQPQPTPATTQTTYIILTGLSQSTTSTLLFTTRTPSLLVCLPTLPQPPRRLYLQSSTSSRPLPPRLQPLSTSSCSLSL
ncbi:hypothetical protein BU16DRAFT_247700 [Lophium mytilinum]|uniref:Uncharacterized protein n=1 Tax=Lophium mytilinum TaxID=390894 RepID=A0A6A6R7A6_9PEZI|nr:hypothetical protein BU16DRAFT_247700 [Lophium mytilinum]